MINKEIETLIEKYLNGRCTPEELHSLLSFFKDNRKDEQLQKLIELYWSGSVDDLSIEELEQAYQKVDSTLEQIWCKEDIQPRRWSRNFKIKFAVAAASVLVILSLSTWNWYSSHQNKQHQIELAYLSFESNSLVLPNGKIVMLSDNPEEAVLWEDKSVKIIQIANDELQLVDKETGVKNKGILTLCVAKGNKAKLHFSDGTIAWVNADSHLQFPLQFETTNRLVSLSGEAYFEVAHANHWPFYVEGKEQLIQVYGTRFNVRSYQSEGVSSTTLFEGKLSVRNKIDNKYREEKILKPGDHYELFKHSEDAKLTVLPKDQKTIGWTTGRIYYNGSTLREIFMDLSHQYLIDVDWENIPDLRYQGYLPEGKDLDQILYVLSRTSNINIKRTNNQIIFN